MLVDARERVKLLLTSKLPDLHSLAQALIEHETLTSSDIDRVLLGEFPRATAAAAAAAARVGGEAAPLVPEASVSVSSPAAAAKDRL